jgi:hypothetical protein
MRWNYASPYWLTFKQAQGLGGNVRKGEKAPFDLPDVSENLGGNQGNAE